ncbi:MAG: glycerophosphodiester phosphodiesterase [Actinomycetia bacterium]|nr:glycerophosphodiester phosphodiesterase [Actinomycetes bacterium]
MNGKLLGPGPLIYAHRGDRSRGPDNTLEAYRLAVEAGADGIELDVRRTSDDKLIMSHDDRYPGHPPFIELTLEEVKETIPQVPTFVEMLASVPQHVSLNVEIKNFPDEADYDLTRDTVNLVVDTIATHDTPERILLSSFDPDSVHRAAAIDPRIVRGLLIREPFDIGTGIEVATSLGVEAIHPRMTYFQPDALGLMDKIHAAGLVAVVWGANTPGDIHTLVEAGVDVVITDDPLMARRTIAQR